jgi:hypothetical protein
MRDLPNWYLMKIGSDFRVANIQFNSFKRNKIVIINGRAGVGFHFFRWMWRAWTCRY